MNSQPHPQKSDGTNMELHQVARNLLPRMLYEKGSEAEMLLECLQHPESEKLNQILETAGSLSESKLFYLQCFVSLKSGDIGAAINYLLKSCHNVPDDKYAFYNMGLIFEAIHEVSGEQWTLNLAMEAYIKAWVLDDKMMVAADALRNIHRDKIGTASDLLNALGKRPRVVLEPTTYCHLKCRGCTRTIEDIPSIHMPLETFRKVLHNMPSTIYEFTLHGLGEPTLNKDLPEMIRLTAESKKAEAITFSTTGMNKDFSIYQKCFDNGLTMLRVSVDSLDPVIAERCRKGTNVELLEQNIRAFVAAKFPIDIVMVVSRMNLDDLEKTMWKLNEMGEFSVRGLLYLDKGEQSGNLNEAEHKRAQSIFESMSKNAKNIKVTMLNDYDPSGYSVCRSVTDITVDVAGYLTPCCHIYDRSIYKHLSLAEHSYEDICRSEFMRDFIHKYVDQAPDFCGGCLMNNRPTHNKSYPSTRDFHTDERAQLDAAYTP
jgi:MoaA/NifB/PqqE/SkfB family radical SAM enzyme